jgi:hypothetical protein
MCTEPLSSIENSTTDFNYYFSKAPSPTVSPSLSPAPSTGPVEGFTYIGEGHCKDSAGEYYSYFGHVLDDANDNDCMQICSQVQHPDFVGVSTHDYWVGRMWCYCCFSGGLPEDVDATDYNMYYSNPGDGPVQSSNGRCDTSCYRYNVSFLSCFLPYS